MSKINSKPKRLVSAGRLVAIGTLAATALGGVAQADSTETWTTGDAQGHLLLAAAGEGGEGGEGEGGGANLAPEVSLMRDLGFMTGHLRAGLALYEAGDLKAAKTHMGHPIEEKYDAVAAPLQERGFGDLKARLIAMSAAVENEASIEEVSNLFDEVIAGVDQVRNESPGTPANQLMGLAELTRVAADEYQLAINSDGSVKNLHEYQDSWGFLRTVEREAEKWAMNDDAGIAGAAQKILQQVEAVSPAYGDLQGNDIRIPDSNLIYGAAARMELAIIAAN